MRSEIVLADLRDFTWDQKKKRTLYGYSEYFAGAFPPKIKMKSHHTGNNMMFVPVSPEHPAFDEDGWDGEMAVYRGDDNILLVLTHAY